ncbi:MAG: PQ-loop domain-containing transporter [Mycoplasmoidaceae bacterium]
MNPITADILSLIFGNISIFMSIAIEAPQLYSILKTKNTSGTSLTTYILFMVASFLWITWSTVNYVANVLYIPSDVTNIVLHVSALTPAILSNFINVVLVGFILFYKIKHLRICKKLNITELEYSKILFDKQKGDSWLKKFYPLIIISFIALMVCVAIVLILYFIGIPKQITIEEYERFATSVLVLNVVAAVFFESMSWPQFIKCMKTKDTSGISLAWAIFLPLSCVVCFSYDLFLAISTGWWNVIASLICSGMIINTAVLILKIKNVLKAKSFGLSDWEYTKKYIKPHK